MNVTRQVLDNRGHALLPQIKAAYEARDEPHLASLTHKWLHLMQLEDSLLATDRWFLLGPWLDAPRAWAKDSTEQRALNYDAHSILTTWGDRDPSRNLDDYANKDWSGLLGTLYYQRWKIYFDSLTAALKTNTEPQLIDWFAIEDAWNRQPNHFVLTPRGDAYTQASLIYQQLRTQVVDWNKTRSQH